MKEVKPIVFGYWLHGKLMGFRADTFGTVSEDTPKIYYYSEDQVRVVVESTKGMLTKDGTTLFKQLAARNTIMISMNGGEISKDSLVDEVRAQEDKVRNWGTFELKVHPFIDYEEGWHYPELWKVQAAIKSLGPAIETYTFTTLTNEN